MAIRGEARQRLHPGVWLGPLQSVTNTVKQVGQFHVKVLISRLKNQKLWPSWACQSVWPHSLKWTQALTPSGPSLTSNTHLSW